MPRRPSSPIATHPEARRCERSCRAWKTPSTNGSCAGTSMPLSARASVEGSSSAASERRPCTRPGTAASCDTGSRFATGAAVQSSQGWSSDASSPTLARPTRIWIPASLRWPAPCGADQEAGPVTVYGKVAADHRGALTAAVVPELRERVLRGEDSPFTVPRSFGFIEPLQLTLLEAVPGRPGIAALLKDRARNGRGDNGARALAASIEAAARVAAALHGSGLALGPKRGIDDELVELGHALAALQRVSPGLGAEFEGWLETLRACAVASDPGEPCLSHGGFTPSQLIFSGERCGLVDFDTVCRAEPALDLAQFLAYLRMNARKAGVPASADGNGATEQLCARFLGAYMIERGYGPRERDALRARVHPYEMVSLLRLAFHSWQKFKPARLELAVELIRERLLPLGGSRGNHA